MRQKKKDEGDI